MAKSVTNGLLLILESKSTCPRTALWSSFTYFNRYIDAITDLKPLGKTYALGLFEDQKERNEIKID